MNDHGQGCFPSVTQQQKDTGLSRPALCKYLDIAVEGGFLKKSTHGFSGQGWARNEYAACLPEGIQLGQPEEVDAGKERNSDNRRKPVNGANHVKTKKTGKAVNDINLLNSDNRPKGGKPDTEKAVNPVYSNSPIELSKEKNPPAGALVAKSEEDEKPEQDTDEPDPQDPKFIIYERKVIRMTLADWTEKKVAFGIDDRELTELLDERDEFLINLPAEDRRRKRWWKATWNWVKGELQSGSA